MKKIKLSDIGVIHTGNTPPKKHEEYYNSNDINFIKPNDIPEDKVDFLEDDSIEYLSFQGAERGRVVPEGSVLVTCIGIIGKVAITTKEVAFNQQINAIVPNQDIVDAEFLAFKLWSERKKLMSTANKSVVPNINKTNFSNYEIEIPSLDKQRKIVNVLE